MESKVDQNRDLIKTSADVFAVLTCKKRLNFRTNEAIVAGFRNRRPSQEFV